MAAACRTGRLILSAINIPKPSPKAARVSASKLSRGSCSGVFGMDIGKGIAYCLYDSFDKNKREMFATD